MISNPIEASKFTLLDRMYEAKRVYYAGRPELTDQEYDALERSIEAIHGKNTLTDWYCVGYNKDRHEKIKGLLQEAMYGKTQD